MRNLLLLLVLASCLTACKKDSKASMKMDTPKDTNTSMKMPKLTKAWESSMDLSTPESVLYDKEMGIYYVSCIGAVPPTAKDGDGYIATIDQRGKLIKKEFAKGLSAPKGMAMDDKHLYVADITDLVVIERNTGNLVKRLPIAGSEFLNDVAISNNGVVYFSDSNTGIIHSYDGESVKTFTRDSLVNGANGVYVDGDELIVASFASGDVLKVSADGSQVNKIAQGIDNGDGVEGYRNGYFISNWKGEVHFVGKDGSSTLLLDTKQDKINAADIELDRDHNLLLVPTFFDNKVVAYHVN